MSRPFNLRTAKTRSSAGAEPTPRARHAQTAGGREILGFWGRVERVVLMGRALVQAAGFPETNLDGAFPFGSNAQRAVFLNAYLRRANAPFAELRGSFWFGTRAAKINLRGANIGAAHISGADLSGANLTGAVLDRADIRNSSFRGALLDHASFRAAQVSGSDFSGATWMGKPDFSGAWAWLDQPPTELDEFAILLCAYDPRADKRDVAPEPCIAPGASE